MKQTILKKLDDLEHDYGKKQNQLEEEIEETLAVKQKFGRELEEVFERYCYYYNQADYTEPIATNQVYGLVDRHREDGEHSINQRVKGLENDREENRMTYQKESRLIEDDFERYMEKERVKEYE